jgi:predicted phosphodiesterase
MNEFAVQGNDDNTDDDDDITWQLDIKATSKMIFNF